ncbi:hypothetical protein ACQEU6_40620 [Spirillospora sp. CA-108201]
MTEDVHLVRADTITGIGVSGEQIIVWQGDRSTTVAQVNLRPQFTANYAGVLAQRLAAAAADPPLDHVGRPFPVVYVWLHLDDADDPCWQVMVAGSGEDSDPPEPPFSSGPLA